MKSIQFLLFVVLALGLMVSVDARGGQERRMVRPRAEDSIKVYLQNYEENEDGSLGEELAECTIRRHAYRNLRADFLGPAGQKVLEPMDPPGGAGPNKAYYALVGADIPKAKQFFHKVCATWTTGYW